MHSKAGIDKKATTTDSHKKKTSRQLTQLKIKQKVLGKSAEKLGNGLEASKELQMNKEGDDHDG